MKRRAFMTLLGGAAAAWPLAARGQQPERMRRIGVLMALAADDPDAQMRIGAFLQALPQLGWTVGRNVQIDMRWATTETDSLRKQAAELAALAPDVLVAGRGTATIAPLLQATPPGPTCSRWPSIRLAPASSRAWRVRAATRLGSRRSNTA